MKKIYLPKKYIYFLILGNKWQHYKKKIQIDRQQSIKS